MPADDWIRETLDAGQVGVWERDLTTGQEECSAAMERLLGLERGEFARRRMRLADCLVAPTLEDVRQLLQGGRPAEDGAAELFVTRPDGATNRLAARFHVVRAGGGAAARLAMLCWDTTGCWRRELALAESEASFRAALDQSPVSLCHLDRNLCYTWVYNPTLPLTASQIIGKTDAEIFPSPAGRELMEAKRAVLETGRAARREVTIEIAGRKHYRDIKIEPVWSPTGQVTGLTCVAVDIGRQKEIEAQLRELNSTLEQRILQRTAELAASEERLQTILDHSPALIYLKDLQGRYVLANRQAAVAAGLPADELRGRTDFELFDVATARGLRNTDLQVIQTGKPQQFEDVFVLADGPHTYITTKFPCFDAQGQIAAVCGISTDITRHRQAEQFLAASEARFRALLETMPDAMLLICREGFVVSAKPAGAAAMALLTSEVGQRRLHDLFPSAAADLLAQQVERALASQEVLSCELVFDTPQGPMWQEARLARLDERHVLMMLRDISQRHQAEERQKRLEDELHHVARLSTLGEIASSLAHELNQPLSALTFYLGGCLDLVRSGRANVADLESPLASASQSAHRCAEIVRRLRLLVTKRPPRLSSIDLRTLVPEVLTLFEYQARLSEVTITVELGSAPLTVLVDSIQIQQVLVNLIQNALEALVGVPPAQRRIAIQAGCCGPEVELSIRDWGPGVRPEDVDRLFTPFFSTKPQGLGMGLCISRSIIERHQGTLMLDQHAAPGARFVIRLPRAEEDSHAD